MRPLSGGTDTPLPRRVNAAPRGPPPPRPPTASDANGTGGRFVPAPFANFEVSRGPLPPQTGDPQRRARTATARAVGLALAALGPPRRGDAAAVTVRVTAGACRAAAGMEPPGGDHDQREALEELRRQWRLASRERPIHLAEWGSRGRPNALPVGHPWGLRALTLAEWCKAGTWGRAVGRPPAPHPALPYTADECAICLETFTDPLPRPRGRARAPPSIYECGFHATCISCERHNQRVGRDTCSLCRAARTLDLE